MKNKMFRILALVIAFSMIFTTIAFAAPKNKRFEHFNKKYEKYQLKIEDYEDALKELIKKQIVKGYGNGDYGLSGNVKRGDVIVMIIRMLENDKNIKLDVDDIKDVFEDVYESDYFYDSIKKAKKLGIAKGNGKYFNPNKPVTVQEAIWLIERAGETLGLDLEDEIIDELENIYEGELKDFAKRRDIFWMLYYVLGQVDVDDDVELDDITINIDSSSQYSFDVEKFEDIFDDADIDIDYITFDLPIKYGTLYVDSVKARNVIESEDTKFYVDDNDEKEIEDIIYVPNKNFNGTDIIKYYAYDGDESYTGLLNMKVNVNKDLTDIKLDMSDESQLDFKDSWFIRAFNDTVKDDDEELEYVKFTLPKEGGTLYYDYDEDVRKNTLVSEKVGYYLGDDEDNLIRNISLIPEKNFKGTVIVGYTAYSEEDSYTGLIKITVDYKTLDSLDYKVLENEYVNLDKDDFKDFITEVTFEIPDTKVGTLYYDIDEDGKPESREVISRKTVYKIDQLDDIIFKPYVGFDGDVVIKYTAYDKYDDVYYGNIKITVGAVQEIPTAKFTPKFTEDNLVIDLVDKLEDLLYNNDSIDIDDLDYVKFDLPEIGTLKIKLNGKTIKNVVENDSYNLDEIEYIKYYFEDDVKVNLNYTVFEERNNADDISYNGLFIIDIR